MGGAGKLEASKGYVPHYWKENRKRRLGGGWKKKRELTTVWVASADPSFPEAGSKGCQRYQIQGLDYTRDD